MKTSTDFFYRYFVLIFTDRIFSIANFVGINWWKYVVGIYRGNPNPNRRNKKNQTVRWHVSFYRCCTDRITVGFKQIYQIVYWCVTYTDRIADGLTNKIILSVNPLVIFNKWPSPRSSSPPPLFLILP
jgi:hypothetical protein